jgi:hypothetical protein
MMAWLFLLLIIVCEIFATMSLYSPRLQSEGYFPKVDAPDKFRDGQLSKELLHSFYWEHLIINSVIAISINALNIYIIT